MYANFMATVSRAERHGWKCDGIAFLGNSVYNVLTLRRNRRVYKFYVQSTTGRKFCVRDFLPVYPR